MVKILPSRFIKKYFLAAIFLLLLQYTFAQTKFSAVCPEKKIGKNEYVEIQYTLENAVNIEQINPPEFKNFTIVSGPNQQSGMSNYNGNIKQYVSIGFVLKPLTTGTFTLSPGSAKADGKVYYSNAISIEVNNSASQSSHSGGTSVTSPFANLNFDFPPDPPVHEYDDYILKKGENVEDKIKKNLFIKADVSKARCYVGEPIIATYKLYTRLKSESNLIKSPSLNGFSVSELGAPGDNTLTTEKFKGRDYSVYILRKVQLYPLQPGTIELDPAQVQNKVTFIRAEYAGAHNGDVFYNMLRDFSDASAPAEGLQEKDVTVQSPPVNITVMPLPETGKPAIFKGAVGNFVIDAVLEKNIITTDDAGNLKISISGTGNIQMVNAPSITWAEGLEGFESKSAENIDKTSVPMKGIKIFTFPFTAKQAGNYVIPPVSFCFFDISSKLYKTITTKAISITVEKGSGNVAVLGDNAANNKPSSAYQVNTVYPYRWYIAAGAAGLLVLLIFVVQNDRKSRLVNSKTIKVENPEKNAIAMDQVIPSNPLIEAERILFENDSSNFYPSLYNALRNYLSVKLDVSPEELNKKKISEQLDKCNVGVGTALILNSLLNEIELNLYAPPSSATHMQAVYEKASEVVSLLDKQC
ncbi:MAG: protein BatD [Chitinophagaceae bacterium]|nr:protein BatD [Chitinophagaceae bacterium]